MPTSSLLQGVFLFAILGLSGDELPAEAEKRIKQFEADADAIRKKADAQIRARKDELIKTLENIAEMYAKEGKADAAAAIRAQIKDLGRPPSRIVSLFRQLDKGMTPKQVETLLGKPVLPPTQQPNGNLEIWYIDQRERQLQPQESPWGPAGIIVIYRDGVLAERKYNHQWVRDR
jgi:vacuolar-type H+-ATPase subunit H